MEHCRFLPTHLQFDVRPLLPIGIGPPQLLLLLPRLRNKIVLRTMSQASSTGVGRMTIVLLQRPPHLCGTQSPLNLRFRRMIVRAVAAVVIIIIVNGLGHCQLHIRPRRPMPQVTPSSDRIASIRLLVSDHIFVFIIMMMSFDSVESI